MKLSEKKCIPCTSGMAPLTADEVSRLSSQLSGWQVNNDKRLMKSYRFDDFKGAIDFADRVAAVAEAQGHHPDLLVRWGEVKVDIWTHKIDALTESDFILAAKIDEL